MQVHRFLGAWAGSLFRSALPSLTSGPIFLIVFLATGVIAQSGNSTTDFLHAVQREGQFWLVGSDNHTKTGLSAFARGAGTTYRFYISPDRHWLFTTDSYRHRGLQDRELYTASNSNGEELTPFSKAGWFSAVAEKFLIKNAVFKKADIFEKPFYDYLQTDCLGWSLDSGRLLACFSSGESSNDRLFYLYFNTRAKSFEETSYLRAFNTQIAHRHLNPEETPLDVLCIEPISSLPSATELTHRLEMLDSELNTIYQAQINKNEQDRDYLRNAERDWIQARDDGLKFYLEHVPGTERQQRRLQFLGDATAKRIFDLTPPDSDD